MIDFEDIFKGNLEKPLTIEEFFESYMYYCQDSKLDDSVPQGFRTSANAYGHALVDKYGEIDYEAIGLDEQEVYDYIGTPECDELLRKVIRRKYGSEEYATQIE